MNRDEKKNPKKDFGKDFLKLMNNAVFGNTKKNVGNHKDIKLVTTDARRNYLVSEWNFNTAKKNLGNFFAIERKKQKYSWIDYFNKVCQY